MLEQRRKEMQQAQRKEAKKVKEECSIAFSVCSTLSTSRHYIYMDAFFH